MVSETPASTTGSGEEALKVEVLIENYKIIAEWIRFADAKAAVTLTVNGVLLGSLIPTLKTFLTEKTSHPTAWWEAAVIVLFLGWLVLLAISAVNSFLCILPFRGTGRKLAMDHTTHFHPMAVKEHFPIEDLSGFLGSCAEVGMVGLKSEVRAAILLDSHLSSSKYGYVTRSIWCLAGSVVFGVFYLLTIQF